MIKYIHFKTLCRTTKNQIIFQFDDATILLDFKIVYRFILSDYNRHFKMLYLNIDVKAVYHFLFHLFLKVKITCRNIETCSSYMKCK